ncbi:hypothetical protein BCL76_104294 [Streptomyces sp. CG 926]|nr:hypothetical protein BCL76_104294 [Streptomyces sp. CG 926]
MTVTPDHVRALADAYRKTLDAGDAIFQGDPLSRKTLVAIVVKSATTQSDWLETRVPNGGELKEDLEGLVSTLAKYDVVGANLASTKQWLRKQTIILIGAVCALVAWPAWVGIVVAWAGGILLGAYSLGYRLGLLLGSTLLMWLCMGVWKAATSKDFRRFLGMPKAIGLQESELFRSHALPALEAMRASHDGASVTGLDTPVVRELRVWAYLLLVLSVVIFVVVATQFVLGLLAAFSCKANAPVIDYPWTPEDDTKVCS